MLVQQIVAQDGLEFFIREKREGVALFAAVVTGNSRGINTDSNNLDSTRLELFELLLETPQLGVAERSPVATIENQEHPLIGMARRRVSDGSPPQL